MTQTELLQRIKERLQALYGARFRGLVLYGSTARGEAQEDSDIDILALLDGPVVTWKEIQAAGRAVYDLSLSQLDFSDEYHSINIIPVDVADYERGAYPLVLEAKREGVLI
jgi:predicted nucleotidyltransferase